MRGAILHDPDAPSLSEFINRAVMAEVRRIEAAHNGGQPFPPLPAGALPQGRPPGS